MTQTQYDDAAELDRAAKVQHAFSDLNRKFEERDAVSQATKWKLPYFDLTGYSIDQSTLALLSEPEAREASAVVFFREGPHVKLGAADPKIAGVHHVLASLKQKRLQPEVYLVSRSGLSEAWGQYRRILPERPSTKYDVPVNTGPVILAQLRELNGASKTRLLEMPMTNLLGMLIGGAVTMRASDMHLEPEKALLKLRYRVDGVLADVLSFPKDLLHPLLSRIKLLSGLKLNVTQQPQDGRFTVKFDGQNLDLRVSVLPSAFGESVVIRLLGIHEVGFQIEALGLRGAALELVKKQLRRPNGMTLTTGPTGSGKTTTLYAFLNFLNDPGVKIVTLEDPVEYELSGITQTPIDHRSGMDFAKGLRSILRQDPDIVMVGEIRDYETVETAAQAALTGHVVLSTLHTNDAAGAIPRMLDLGVKPVTLAPALNTLIAQRLLRRLCQDCREPYHLSVEEQQHVRLALSHIPESSGVEAPKHLTFYKSRGCEKCHHLGYRGRVGVFEVFRVDEKIQRLIFDQSSSLDIKKAAVQAGMLTMQQDGLLKALQGLTDLSEVWRVTEE